MQSNVQRTEPAMARAHGIEICYQTFGDPQAAPLLLVDGHGCQMIEWDDDWCAQLAGRGYWVIRYDRRDRYIPTMRAAPAPH